jgi:hypothetical protein
MASRVEKFSLPGKPFEKPKWLDARFIHQYAILYMRNLFRLQSRFRKYASSLRPIRIREESSSNMPATTKKVSCNRNCSCQHSCSLTVDGGSTIGFYDLIGPIFVENVQLVQRKRKAKKRKEKKRLTTKMAG